MTHTMPPRPLKLHGYWRSSAAYRVRIALNLKQRAFESVSWSLAQGAHRSAAFDSLNPQHLVPVLEDGSARLTQSLAILEYLEERWPDPPLLPAAPAERAAVRAFAQAIACDIHPLNNLRVLNYLKGELGLEEARVNAWYRHWIAEGLPALEASARRTSTRATAVFGDTISFADVCLVPQLYNARRYHCDLSATPTLTAIAAALERHPAFEAARPEGQPDAT